MDTTKKDSLRTTSKVERSKLAVWDYPVSDKYTKVWRRRKQSYKMTLQGDADIPNWPTICFVDLAIHEGGWVALNIWGGSP